MTSDKQKRTFEVDSGAVVEGGTAEAYKIKEQMEGEAYIPLDMYSCYNIEKKLNALVKAVAEDKQVEHYRGEVRKAASDMARAAVRMERERQSSGRSGERLRGGTAGAGDAP